MTLCSGDSPVRVSAVPRPGKFPTPTPGSETVRFFFFFVCLNSLAFPLWQAVATVLFFSLTLFSSLDPYFRSFGIFTRTLPLSRNFGSHFFLPSPSCGFLPWCRGSSPTLKTLPFLLVFQIPLRSSPSILFSPFLYFVSFPAFLHSSTRRVLRHMHSLPFPFFLFFLPVVSPPLPQGLWLLLILLF